MKKKNRIVTDYSVSSVSLAKFATIMALLFMMMDLVAFLHLLRNLGNFLGKVVLQTSC